VPSQRAHNRRGPRGGGHHRRLSGSSAPAGRSACDVVPRRSEVATGAVPCGWHATTLGARRQAAEDLSPIGRPRPASPRLGLCTTGSGPSLRQHLHCFIAIRPRGVRTLSARRAESAVPYPDEAAPVFEVRKNRWRCPGLCRASSPISSVISRMTSCADLCPYPRSRAIAE
jgi:hypothetical protein